LENQASETAAPQTLQPPFGAKQPGEIPVALQLSPAREMVLISEYHRRYIGYPIGIHNNISALF
jgi:hypothetical protein